MRDQLRLLRPVWHPGEQLHAALLFARLAYPQAAVLRGKPTAGLLRLKRPRYSRLMAVGGRVGRWKVSALLSLGIVLPCAAAGCGSRTSVLDQDGFVALGGSAATGSGGTNGATGGVAGATASVDPRRAEAACQRYCEGYRVVCSALLGGRDCVPTCVAEASASTQQCQTYAMSVLDCFTPFFASTRTCTVADSLGRSACAEQLSRYNSCQPAPRD